jgi:hypothetical protein
MHVHNTYTKCVHVHNTYTNTRTHVHNTYTHAHTQREIERDGISTQTHYTLKRMVQTCSNGVEGCINRRARNGTGIVPCVGALCAKASDGGGSRVRDNAAQSSPCSRISLRRARVFCCQKRECVGLMGGEIITEDRCVCV